MHVVAASLVIVVAVDLFFSFAAYGLSEPYWYFFGGLSVVTVRLATKLSRSPAAVGPGARWPQLRRGLTITDFVARVALAP